MSSRIYCDNSVRFSLKSLESSLTLISRFETKESYFARTMCYVNNNTVITAIHGQKGTYKTAVYDEAGILLKEWTPCHGISITIMGFQIHGKDYLLEGCRICNVIRGCEFPQTKFKILYKPIFPSCMCKGPDGSILVFERLKKSIKQLRYYEGQFHPIKQFSTKFEAINSLCYSRLSDIVTVVKGNAKAIAGIDFSMEKVVWQNKALVLELGSFSQPLNRIQDTLTLPDGRVCIISYDAIYVLDPVDGTILHKLMDLNSSDFIWAAITCQLDNQQTLAIAEDDAISVYEIPFHPPEDYHCILKQGITS